MITLEEAKALQYGEILINEYDGRRWKVNGKPQIWVRSPERVRVPLKHGLYAYAQMYETDLYNMTKED